VKKVANNVPSTPKSDSELSGHETFSENEEPDRSLHGKEMASSAIGTEKGSCISNESY